MALLAQFLTRRLDRWLEAQLLFPDRHCRRPLGSLVLWAAPDFVPIFARMSLARDSRSWSSSNPYCWKDSQRDRGSVPYHQEETFHLDTTKDLSSARCS